MQDRFIIDPIKTQPTCPSFSFYTCNQDLLNRQIFIHKRIIQWFEGNGTNCQAIINQHYLESNSIRNDTLRSIIKRDNLSLEQAVEKIIFQHRIPYALLEYSIVYGKRLIQSQESFTVYTLLYVQDPHDGSGYYQSEVTGKTCNDHIKIWHAFLRPISVSTYLKFILNNYKNETLPFLSETPNPTPYLNTTDYTQGHREHLKKDQEEGFYSVNQDTYRVEEKQSIITIHLNDRIFTLFKS